MILEVTTLPILTAGIGGLGPWELGIILVIVLVVFGAGRLPAIGSAIGKALKNFKSSIQDKSDKDEPPKDPS
jgi:sec-independent protein translocase protein TatA